jgi:hypothetical protein
MLVDGGREINGLETENPATQRDDERMKTNTNHLHHARSCNVEGVKRGIQRGSLSPLPPTPPRTCDACTRKTGFNHPPCHGTDDDILFVEQRQTDLLEDHVLVNAC